MYILNTNDMGFCFGVNNSIAIYFANLDFIHFGRLFIYFIQENNNIVQWNI